MNSPTKTFVHVLLFALIPAFSFIYVMSSLVPIYSPARSFYGVAIELTTNNYILELLAAAVCFVTTVSWFFLAGISWAEYKHNKKKD